jgi:hyperosmotically inducible protein
VSACVHRARSDSTDLEKRKSKGASSTWLTNSCKASFFVVFTLVASLGSQAWATSQNSPAAEQAPAPDNTKSSARDENKSAVTADQQKEARSDRETARQIRRAIIKDEALSNYAHNIKVIVQNGTVTLRGPVRSDDEKTAHEAKATQVVGESKVR